MKITKRAVSFMEYAIIIGIISVVLMSMNTYMKRGVQGRIKDMTDHFIGEQQVAEINPTVSSQGSSQNTTMTGEMGIGGTMDLALLDTRSSSATSTVEDRLSPYGNPFIPAEAGFITPINRTDDSQFINQTLVDAAGPNLLQDPNYESNWQTSTDIGHLERAKARALADADARDASATTFEEQAAEMHAKANAIDCPSRRGRRRCKNAKKQMHQKANELTAQAAEKRTEAADLRDEAAQIQARIDELRASLTP